MNQTFLCLSIKASDKAKRIFNTFAAQKFYQIFNTTFESSNLEGCLISKRLSEDLSYAINLVVEHYRQNGFENTKKFIAEDKYLSLLVIEEYTLQYSNRWLSMTEQERRHRDFEYKSSSTKWNFLFNHPNAIRKAAKYDIISTRSLTSIKK